MRHVMAMSYMIRQKKTAVSSTSEGPSLPSAI
jgi:hypothetical protein